MAWRVLASVSLLVALLIVLGIGWLVWMTVMPMAFPFAPAALLRPDFIPFAFSWLIAGVLVAACFPRSE
jgi:biotin transporter BioY